MAFTAEEQQIINFGIQNGKTQDEVRSAIQKYRNSIGYREKENAGYLSRVGSAVKEQATGAYEDWQTQADRIRSIESNKKQTLGSTITTGLKEGFEFARSGLRTAGRAAVAAFTPITEAPKIKEGLEWTGEKITNSETIGNISDKLTQSKLGTWAYKHPEALRDLQDIIDITALAGLEAPIRKVISNVGTGLKEGIPRVESAIKTGITELPETARGVADTVKNVLGKPQTAQKALGEVLQGGTKDLGAGLRAISEIDTVGVKTFEEFAKRIATRIPELAKVVDDALDNVVKIPLKELATRATSSAGKEVSTNFVERATSHLKELYTKTGDILKAQNMDEFIKRMTTEGITRQEVNMLAREYGEVFGQKAFSKTGEALTSVNARLFEGTRSGLKSVARQGLGGDVAKSADKALSDLYRVQRLINKNMEGVNKITQRIQNRGLLEKLGHGAAKALDVMTGGGIRGIVGGFLPRGVGYKTMNMLDIEAALEKNLQIINKALQSPDSYLLKLLQKAHGTGEGATKTATGGVTAKPNTNPAKVVNYQSNAENAKLAVETPKGRIQTKLSPAEQKFFMDEIKNLQQTKGKNILHLDSGAMGQNKVRVVSREEFLRLYPEAKKSFEKFKNRVKS